MAYELELPRSSRVHNVFHGIGAQCSSSELPPLDEEGKLILIPKAIIDTREHTLRRRTIKEYFVKWKNMLVEDAKWESEQILQHLELQLLGDKQIWGGRTVMSPSQTMTTW